MDRFIVKVLSIVSYSTPKYKYSNLGQAILVWSQKARHYFTICATPMLPCIWHYVAS